MKNKLFDACYGLDDACYELDDASCELCHIWSGHGDAPYGHDLFGCELCPAHSLQFDNHDGLYGITMKLCHTLC